MYKILFINLFVLLIPVIGFSQTNEIKGKVTDGATGEPLIGANIIIKGTTKGTTTDYNGDFTIAASSDDIIEIRYLGYITEEFLVGNQTQINVDLDEDTQSLEEVVVIGYGRVKKSDLSGSVTSVKSEDIVKVPSSNPVQALQGKAAGVQVTSASGTPGSNPIVRIRGVGSFNVAAPIYVVDGLILDDISFLSSSDIESMEVLKDASATAIYGSRGANGVIMVTTKKGQLGQGVVYNVSSEYGIQNVAHKIDLLNGREFATIYNEISPGSFNNLDALPNTDWQDLIFSTGSIQNHQISASGASEMMQYYVSLGYFNEQGIIDDASYERINLKFNNIYHLSDHVKVGNNISISPYKQHTVPNATYQAYRAQPIIDPYLDNGDYAAVKGVGNPLASLAYSDMNTRGLRTVGNIYAEVNFLQDFTFKSSYGVDFLYSQYESFTPQYTIYYENGDPSAQQSLYSSLTKRNTNNLNWLFENTINYFKEVDKHRIDVVGGFTLQESKSEYIKLIGENLIRDDEDFWYINPENIYDATNDINNISDIENKVDADLFYSMVSYLFRANYTYDDRYILTTTFRRDGSSKFTTENQYANFPSFAVGWNIINESFMSSASNILSNLKLRASWGKIGNEKIKYTGQYSVVTSGLFGVFGVDETTAPGASFGVTGNPDLKWETSKQTDIGLEIGILNNKLTTEFDYYRKETEDILVELSMPGYLGNGVGVKQWVNAGSVLNKGFEFNVNWRDYISRDFSYSIGINGFTVHNEVLAIGGSAGIDSTLIGGELSNGRTTTLSKVGTPIGAFYGYKTDGVFQNQAELDAYPHLANAGVGDLRFVDVNGDGELTTADRTNLGSGIPDFIFGFNFQVAYKFIDFGLDFQGQVGNEIFNGKEVVRPDPYNFEQRMMDRWTGEGTSNTVPRPSFDGYNYNISDYFIQDGSFLRLRTASIGFNLPENITKKLQLNSLRIYLRGTNLLTWTKYTGYSPEVVHIKDDKRFANVMDNGLDLGTYPISRVFSAGINIKF